MLYFSVAQICVDFVIFTSLCHRARVRMENEKVCTEVVFEYLLGLSSSLKLYF